MTVSEKSYAKINLFLQILGKREDGFHDLNTLFTKIDLYDTLTIRPSEQFSITCSNNDVPADESNIVWKIKDIVEERYGIQCNIQVHIDKLIPMGGGLGGGSSNAATFLKMLNRYFNLGMTMGEKTDILASVGSDTVFFLYDQPMLGTSRGEILESVPPLPNLNLLIVNPSIFVSTGQIFGDKNLRLTAFGEVIRMRLPLTLNDLVKVMSNDLETPVFKKFPLIKEIKEILEGKGAVKAMMSGSGSTLFGIFNDKDKLNEVYKYFTETYPDFFVTKTINI